MWMIVANTGFDHAAGGGPGAETHAEALAGGHAAEHVGGLIVDDFDTADVVARLHTSHSTRSR